MQEIVNPQLSKHHLLSTFRNTEPTYAEALVNTLVESVNEDIVVWQHSARKSLVQAIAKIDKLLSKQINKILHAEAFKQLESRWRGLYYLVFSTSEGSNLIIKMLSISKQQALQDIESHDLLEQTQLFNKIYENEFGTPGGEPFSILVGDYSFNHATFDLKLLEAIAKICAISFTPFLTSADPTLFGINSWCDITKSSELKKIFSGNEYIAWNTFRKTEHSRFIAMTLPRVLSRLPYSAETLLSQSFFYDETLNEQDEVTYALPHDDYCWMNAAYLLAERIAQAHITYGWPVAIRGAEGGGKVTGLPIHLLNNGYGERDYLCPTEVTISDRRELELSELGFIPLCHYKNTDYAVFIGSQSLQKPQIYHKSSASENALISTRLPYLLASARFAHYLKVLARDKMGSYATAEECEAWLNQWILQYVNSNPHSSNALKAKYPLSEAQVLVQESADKPGAYHAVAWLRPWLQMEQLTASLRLVAEIPQLHR
jgi:type VI secretion system protein ImpC